MLARAGEETAMHGARLVAYPMGRMESYSLPIPASGAW